MIAAELNIEEKKSKIEKILRWKKTGRGQPPAYLDPYGKDTPLKKLHGSQQVSFESEEFEATASSRRT